MQARLLQKIEDLTLYIIQLKKEAQVREKKLAMLEKAVGSRYQLDWAKNNEWPQMTTNDHNWQRNKNDSKQWASSNK